MLMWFQYEEELTFTIMKLTYIIFYVLTLKALFALQPLYAMDNASILLYHHVSDSTPDSTSLSKEQFRAHMQYLKDHHVVLPLNEIVKKLQAKQPLPDKAVAITFDDGYRDILENAHPILKEYGFSYTIFINPDMVGLGDDFLDWSEIKHMSKDKVIFANHGEQHQHFLQRRAKESEQDWLHRVNDNIQDAEKLLTEKLGYSLKYIAYPYGEYNNKLKMQLEKQGYVGFGQHSGAIASYSDFSALPRFPAAGVYANLNTLKVKLASLAMPVNYQLAPNPELRFEQSPRSLSIEINSDDINPQQIKCYTSGDVLKSSWNKGKLLIELDEEITPPRSRVNCTTPSIEHKGRYYWYSQPWFKPNKLGQWLN
jgi:poly-beta-1,6-N-acetyl-D-glucosamine N-deacetylase